MRRGGGEGGEEIGLREIGMWGGCNVISHHLAGVEGLVYGVYGVGVRFTLVMGCRGITPARHHLPRPATHTLIKQTCTDSYSVLHSWLLRYLFTHFNRCGVNVNNMTVTSPVNSDSPAAPPLKHPPNKQ